MQEWLVSATASDADVRDAPASVKRFLERRGALSVFSTIVGADVLRVVFRWRAPSREGAERDAAELVREAMAEDGHPVRDVRAIAR
jgi:hypothetical protein